MPIPCCRILPLPKPPEEGEIDHLLRRLPRVNGRPQRTTLCRTHPLLLSVRGLTFWRERPATGARGPPPIQLSMTWSRPPRGVEVRAAERSETLASDEVFGHVSQPVPQSRRGAIAYRRCRRRCRRGPRPRSSSSLPQRCPGHRPRSDRPRPQIQAGRSSRMEMEAAR